MSELTERMADIRRGVAAPRSGQLYEMPTRTDDWIKEALRLRQQRWSYQRISDELGISYRRVYKALNERRVRDTNARYGHAHRHEITLRNLQLRKTKAPRCTNCGVRMSRDPKAIQMCRECILEIAQRRRALIAGLWLAGYNQRQIVEALGETSSPNGNGIGTAISQMRAAGWDLPRRRPGPRRR